MRRGGGSGSDCGSPPAVFCIYYISRGVLQENKLELVVFVLSLLVVMVRSLINFIVVGPEGRKELLVGRRTSDTARVHKHVEASKPIVITRVRNQ